MFVNLDKTDLISLCKSLTPPFGGDKYSVFCGNQWNEDWKWKDGVFERMSEDQLYLFYKKRRKKQK